MNRYEASIPRTALGLAAITLTALTIGLSVIAPAKMEPGNQEAHALAASQPLVPVASDPATGSTRIEVIAVRDPTFATVPVRHLESIQPKRKQQS